jgi:hypothetical protein
MERSAVQTLRCASSLGSFESEFSKCGSEGRCLPESLVKNGTKVELKKCDSALGYEGRCFSRLAKQIDSLDSKNLATLEEATAKQCGQEELCLPCKDPTNGDAETGVCFKADTTCK